eukprot:10831130-Karenia_brevis.AAC.1
MQKAKAPDEMEIYQHQGLAWVVGAQAIIRLCRRSLEAPVTPKGIQHQKEVLAAAKDHSTSYSEDRVVIDISMAN